MLKILLQEDGNAISEASKSISSATQKVVDVKDSIVGYFGDDKKPAEKSAPSKSIAYIFLFVNFWIVFEINEWNNWKNRCPLIIVGRITANAIDNCTKAISFKRTIWSS